MKKTTVGYVGDEVAVAESLEWSWVEPGMPPKRVAASLPIVDLIDGEARANLLCPEQVRLEEQEVDASWKKARVRASSAAEADLIVNKLEELNICE